MFSIVVGCGNSSQVSDGTTKEEIQVPESTIATTESTTPEATTVGEQVNFLKASIDYSLYSISEETKAMLIEKLTKVYEIST